MDVLKNGLSLHFDRLNSPSVPSLASVDWFFPNLKGVKEDSAVLTPLVKVQNSPKTGEGNKNKIHFSLFCISIIE